jgi:hypothetical protein
MKQSPVKKNDTKIRMLFLLLGAVIATGIILGIRMWSPVKPKLENKLSNLANEVNKNCPVMIDEGTRFDNVVLMPGNIYQFRYTLINNGRENIDPERLKTYVLPNVIENIRTSTDLKYHRDNKVTFSYYYKDMRGDYVTDFSVSAADYAQAAKKAEAKK